MDRIQVKGATKSQPTTRPWQTKCKKISKTTETITFSQTTKTQRISLNKTSARAVRHQANLDPWRIYTMPIGLRRGAWCILQCCQREATSISLNCLTPCPTRTTIAISPWSWGQAASITTRRPKGSHRRVPRRANRISTKWPESPPCKAGKKKGLML